MKKLLLILLVAPFLCLAQKSRSDLQTQANTIKNATVPGSNTAVRIGNMFLDIVNSMQNIAPASDAIGTNTYEADVSPSVTSYIFGQVFLIDFTNTNTTSSTISINGLAAKSIRRADGTNVVAGDLKRLTWIGYDGTNFQVIGLNSGGGGGSESVFEDDITFVLSGSKTFGKYTNGQTAAWEGLTAVEALEDAAIEYIDPVFTSFSVTGQATTVEVGTTISGSKTFTWAITANSGVVSTINIYDLTFLGTLIAGTPNDGSQAVTVNTAQLNTDGSQQIWRGIGNNSSPSGTFNSSNFTVTSRYYRFFGPASSSPANSAAVRALPSFSFKTSTTFTLATGSSLTKFVVALPPGITISSVIDQDALGADITSQYVLTGTISVLDAGATNRAYNIYEMNIGAPYSSSHNHFITTN